MVLWINSGVTAKISRHYTENVCKGSLKNNPRFSQCFQHTTLSLQVSVKITDSSTWLWTSQPEPCSFRLLQPSACPVLELNPKWWLCSWAWGGTAHRVERVLGLVGCGRRRWRGTFLPTEEFPAQLESDRWLCCPPYTFSSLSLARHPPCASRSSPGNMHPAITLNIFRVQHFEILPASPLFSILLVWLDIFLQGFS